MKTTNQKETPQDMSLNSPIGRTASDLELPITTPTPMASDELAEAQIGMFIVWMEMGAELGFDAVIHVNNDTVTIQSNKLANAIKLRMNKV